MPFWLVLSIDILPGCDRNQLRKNCQAFHSSPRGNRYGSTNRRSCKDATAFRKRGIAGTGKGAQDFFGHSPDGKKRVPGTGVAAPCQRPPRRQNGHRQGVQLQFLRRPGKSSVSCSLLSCGQSSPDKIQPKTTPFTEPRPDPGAGTGNPSAPVSCGSVCRAVQEARGSILRQGRGGKGLPQGEKRPSRAP